MLTRRRTSFWLAGLTIAVVAAVAIFGRQRFTEEWYIYRLGSANQAVIDDAAMRLGEMKSTRAIQPLLVAWSETESGFVSDFPDGVPLTNSFIAMALLDIGAPVATEIERTAEPSQDLEVLRRLIDSGRSPLYIQFDY